MQLSILKVGITHGPLTERSPRDRFIDDPRDALMARILTEARVVNHIGHANIVDIFETGQLPDGRLYIVMERLEGRPLAAFASEGKLLPDEASTSMQRGLDAFARERPAHVELKLTRK